MPEAVVPKRSHVRFRILALIFLVTTVNFADRAALSITGPSIQTEFGFDVIRMGYIFSAFSWAYVFSQVPGGWLIDRFGALPDEVKHLFDIVAIKQLCRVALVEKIDAGPKGGTIAFRNNQFPNPLALVKLINEHSGTMKVRPDQKVVVTRDWPSPESRLNGVKNLMGQLAKLAAKAA